MGNTKLNSATFAVLTLLVLGAAGSELWAGDTPVTRAADSSVAAPEVATLERLPATDSNEVQACMSAYPNDCGDYPVPQGGTCNCSSQLAAQSCTTCESGQHGSVLVTTCRVCAPCQHPPCHELFCPQYESSSCQAGRN